jgi:hypothetical protein
MREKTAEVSMTKVIARVGLSFMSVLILAALPGPYPEWTSLAGDPPLPPPRLVLFEAFMRAT